MRRMVMVAMLALFAPATASAQIFELVPQIGLSSGSYSGDDVESGNYLGYMIGAKARIGSPLYVDGGIFWANSGGEAQSPDGNDDVTYKSVRIPVTVGYRILPLRIVTVRVFAGGVANLVSSVNDNDFGITDDDVKSSIWAGRVGAGADLMTFAVDLAYEFGVTNVLEDSVGAGDVKQNQWVVEAGLRFGI